MTHLELDETHTLIGTSSINNYSFRLDRTLISQNVAANTSTIRWRMYIISTGSFQQTSSGTSITVNVGNQVLSQQNRGLNFPGIGSTLEIGSGETTIDHATDGTCSITSSFSASQTWTGGGRFGAASASTTDTLPTIPRQVDIANVTGGPFTSNNLRPVVTWLPNGNPIRVRIELPDLTGTAPWRSWENPPGESLTMDLSQEDIDDLLQRMSDTNTTRLRFVVATLIGGVEQFWSFGDQVFNIVDGQPIFTDFNYRDSNNSVSAVTGNNQVLVQGLSALEVTVTAAQSMVARLFSNPNRYSFHFGATDVSASFSPTQDVIVSLGVPTAAGVDRQLTVRAIDSRGNNTPVARAINVIPYTTPEIAASVAREGGFDTQTTLSIAGMFSLVEVGGVAKNTVSSSTGVRYRMKQSASGTWGAWTGVTAMIGSDGSISVADVLINADNKQQWDFEVQIQDLFSVSTVPLTLSVGLPILFVDSRRRVGVNKMPELGDLDVSGDIYSDGGKVATIPSLMLGYAESTSVFTGGNNAVVPTEVTFTVPGGVSRVKITFWCGNAYSTLLNGGGEVIVWSGNVGSGTQLCRGRCTRSGDFGSISVTAQRVMDVMPGQTYTIRAGTWNWDGGQTVLGGMPESPFFLMAEVAG